MKNLTVLKSLTVLSILTVLFVFACAPAEEPAAPEPAAEPEPAPEPVAPEPPTAEAVLHNPEGEEVGVATFAQTESGVLMTAEVKGVERDGPHGFHVHEVGACEPDFKAAGGHFNPKGTEHACPDNPVRHGGDFGNIEIVEGAGRLEIPSDLVTVSPGETSIVGRAVILHAGTDDCVGQPTGDAGSRLACGVIHLKMPMAEEAEGGEAETADGSETEE